MTMPLLREQVKQYTKELQRFIDRYKLPLRWFDVPDHFAVKGADSDEYEYWVEILKPASEQITFITERGRRLAAAKLSGTMAVGGFGEVAWVEIMEPRPEMVGKDVVGVEHMEFYYPDFTEVQAYLGRKGASNNLQSNPGHSWVNVMINRRGNEVKFNDRTLADVVAYELAHDEATVLYQEVRS